MKRILVTLAFIVASKISLAQSFWWESIADCYHPVFDSTGSYVFILTSDLEKWRKLKPDQRVPTFSENLEYNGYYRIGAIGNYERIREEDEGDLVPKK